MHISVQSSSKCQNVRFNTKDCPVQADIIVGIWLNSRVVYYLATKCSRSCRQIRIAVREYRKLDPLRGQDVERDKT